MPCTLLTHEPTAPTPHALLTYLPLCPHRSLWCLPYPIRACTHDQHIQTHIYPNRLPHLPHIPASLDHNLHTCSPHAYTHACTHTSTCLCPSIPRYPMPYTLRTPELTHHTYTSITVVPPCLPHSETACTQDYHMVAHAPMPLPIDVVSCHAPQPHAAY
jgi:hypothetical protein